MVKKVIYGNRTEWQLPNGHLHREDGPAAEHTNGERYWYRNNAIHREDGPAMELPNGSKYWLRNGLRHREDGPAVELANGEKYWHLNGKYIPVKSQEEFLRYIKCQVLW